MLHLHNNTHNQSNPQTHNAKQQQQIQQQQQLQLQKSQPQLPYQPIKFVYTETIGSLDQKFKQIIDPYTWTYQDLLQPKILFTKSKVEYYLYHIAPIYNWLRQVGSPMLATYIEKIDTNSSKITNPNNNSSHKFTSNNTTKQTPTFSPFSQEVWMFEMKHQISQWEIAKLCASAKIKIITTKTDNDKTNHYINKSTNSNNNTKNQSNKSKYEYPFQNQSFCSHLIKKDQFTTEYTLKTTLNDKGNKQSNSQKTQQVSLPKLQCLNAYCAQCQRNVNIKSEIIKYPFAPYFNKYHGKEFTIISNQSQQTKLTYQLVIMYCLQKVYVKSSGGVWYQISFKENKKSIVSFQKIQHKNGLIFVYQQLVNSKGDKILRKAEPVKIEQFKKEQKSLVDLSKFISKQPNNDQSGDENYEQPKKAVKTMPKVQKKLQYSLKITTANRTDQINQQQKAAMDQQLEDMTKTPLPIILNKKKTDRKLFKQYKKTVESLLPKPKQKDDYEKQYDKGKTKKIHKNKQQFRTADFFSLYNKLKGTPKLSTENNTENQHHMPLQDQNNTSAKDINKKQQKNDDQNDDYNVVYQGKRNDRFGDRRGRGGFRGRGGKYNDRNGMNGRGGRGGRGGYKDKSKNDRHKGNNSYKKSNFTKSS